MKRLSQNEMIITLVTVAYVIYTVISWQYFMSKDTGSGPGPSRGAIAYGFFLEFIFWDLVASLVLFSCTLFLRKTSRPLFIVAGVTPFALLIIPALGIVVSLF